MYVTITGTVLAFFRRESSKKVKSSLWERAKLARTRHEQSERKRDPFFSYSSQSTGADKSRARAILFFPHFKMADYHAGSISIRELLYYKGYLWLFMASEG